MYICVPWYKTESKRPIGRLFLSGVRRGPGLHSGRGCFWYLRGLFAVYPRTRYPLSRRKMLHYTGGAEHLRSESFDWAAEENAGTQQGEV